MAGYRSYKFRIYPTQEQEVLLKKTIGCSRKIYNLLLDKKISDFSLWKDGSLSEQEFIESQSHCTPAYFKRMEIYSYLKEVDSLALANAQMNVNTAFKRFFSKKSKFPRFKSKRKSSLSYKTNNQNGTVRFESNDKFLRLPKVGKVRVKKHRSAYGALKSVTISLSRSGKWYASVIFDEKTKDYTAPYDFTGSFIGIDLGIKELAIDSIGNHYPNPKYMYKYSSQLAREQRKLAKKYELWRKEGSPGKLSDRKNYQKQKVKVARIHEKIRNSRVNNIHNMTHLIVKNHDIICVENLNVAGMTKNHKLAKSVYDSSMSEIIRQLEYKCERSNKLFFKIDRFFPSTQTCSSCDSKTGPRGIDCLDIREWTCSHCSTTHDRDVNAAKNILKQGLSTLEKEPNNRGSHGDSLPLN